MKKRRVLLFLVLLLVMLGIVGNQFLVMTIRSEIEKGLREESLYPVKIGRFFGALPIGRFWFGDAQFITPMDGVKVEWTIPKGFLNLKASAALTPVWAVDGLLIENLRSVVRTDDGNLTVEGVFELFGKSIGSMPNELPPGSIWCPHVSLTSPSIDGLWLNNPLGSLHDSRLVVSPFAFFPDSGKFILPFDFSLNTFLTPDTTKSQVSVKGNMTPEKNELSADIQLLSIDPATIDQVIASASKILVELREEKASNYIRDGSISVRLRADANPRMVKGEITLRLKGLQFGDLIRESEFAGDQTERILGMVEKRTDTLQLGPVPFAEDLSTPEEEAVDQIQKGFIAEAARLAVGSGLMEGLGMLKGLMGN